MSEHPLISVVTPFHNTADYLEQCIASVLSQSYGHFEYLLCDNCSTDGSTEIAQAYAGRDSRIRFLRFDQLLPQVANYNRALEHVDPNAEWCKIVQADDWISVRCLEQMVRVGKLDDRIGLVGAQYLLGSDVYGRGLPGGVEVFDGREVCRIQLETTMFFMGSPTSVMYRAGVVRGRRPFYTLDRYHEDSEACYEILEQHDFGFVHEPLSSFRIGNPSIMASRESFNTTILDRLIIAARYAHRFLPSGKAAAVTRAATRRYYRFLGESVFHLRRGDFWKYHAVGLATVGWHLSWPRVLLEALLVAAGDPRKPCAAFLKVLRYGCRRMLGRA